MPKPHRTAGLDQLGPIRAPKDPGLPPWRPPFQDLSKWRKELAAYKSGQARRQRKSKITLPGDES